MSDLSRRRFLRWSSVGLAATGAASVGALVLRADAEPTPGAGTLDKHRHVLDNPAPTQARTASLRPDGEPSKGWDVTGPDQLGPFYREGSPYRGKVTPPMEPGALLVVTGRVWGHDSRRPLPGAVLDVWQADVRGQYEADGGAIRLRARVAADEAGAFEYETVYPGHYDGRPGHVHHIVRAPGYETLVTQLYFEGDANNANEALPDQLVIALDEVRSAGGAYRRGVFDIVLAPAA